MKVWITVAMTVLIAANCHRSASPKPSDLLHKYKLEGRVIRIDMKFKRATIDHKEIVGFMEAMTMSYRIPDPKELAKIKVGDFITATVYQRSFDEPYWIADIIVKR